MANKILGYGIAVVGGVISVLSFSNVRDIFKITLPFSFSDTYILIAGLVLLGVGAILSYDSSPKTRKEVPIYHGEKIVGFRRMGK